MSTSWAVVDELDKSDVLIAMHVLPVKEAQSVFSTEVEAQAFANQMNELDCCIMDVEGKTMLTYHGHKLSKNCDCKPQLENEEALTPMYLHRMPA